MNQRKKIRFNVADVILVLFAASVTILLALYLFAGNTNYDFSPKKNVYIHVLIEKTDSKNVSLISAGDVVYNSITGERLGVIEKIESVQSGENIFYENEEQPTLVYYPDLSDIYVTVKAEVTEKSLSEYKTGQTLSACVPKFAFEAEIYNISDYPSLFSQDFSRSSDSDNSDGSDLKAYNTNAESEAAA